ncbi:MAG: HAD family phosphatase [Granulosicoccus sp.]|nr:HAD family phosphatase [Granulosicoccus sp.]
MNIDAAIFDLDGLLIDTERYSKQAFVDTASAFALGNRSELFLSLVGTNEETHTKKLAQELGDRIDSTLFRQQWKDRYHEAIATNPPQLMDGVRHMLEWLTNEKIKCAVATSSTTTAGEKKLLDAGIRDFFQTVTCGDQVSRSKPHPDIFLKAGESIEADMSRSIGFEDSPNGVRAAHAAGLHVIQIPNLVAPTEELLKLDHSVCESMHHALELITSWHN